MKKEYYTDVKVIGNNIFYRGVSDGKDVKVKLPWQPTLFLPSKEPTDWKTISGSFVKPTVIGDIRETRDFIRKYEEVENFAVYGNTRLEYNYIAETFPDEHIDWDANDVEITNIDIEVVTDRGFPNPMKAEHPIVSVTLYSSKRKHYYVYGLKPFDVATFLKDQSEFVKRPFTKEDITYTHCKTEEELLAKLVDFWQKELKPNIVTGWYVKGFDIPYICNRIYKLLGESDMKRLSVWNMVKQTDELFMRAKTIPTFEILGTTVLDYLELYWKFTFGTMESNKLDHVCHEEIGERKLSYDEYSSLNELYEKNFQKFLTYNIRDVWLVERLNDKMQLLQLALTLAYDSKTNYDDVFAQVTMWDQIIHCHLLRKNIVIPPKKRNDKSAQYEGAYVKEPQVGGFNWVASFDLNSLYPHLIMQYNISPEMLVEAEYYTPEMRRCISNGVSVDKMLYQQIDTQFLQKEKITLTPNGQFFHVEKQGFLAEIMEKMYLDRTAYKKKAIEAKKAKEACHDKAEKTEIEKRISKYDLLQNAKKVCLNSAYGAIGSEYFRYFDTRLAEAVTLSGQLSARWIEKAMNEYLNKLLKTEDVDYVIASDTDSVYLNLEGVVSKVPFKTDDVRARIKALDAFCNARMQPLIDKSYQELAFYVNAFQQKMQMKRETLANKAIWTAKKRYILNAYDVEGVVYEEPQIKVKGIESIKSSTPAAVRAAIKNALKVIMGKGETALHTYVADFKREFMKLPIEDVCFPRGVNGMLDYRDKDTVYRKGTPMHVKGCLLYNAKLKELQLDNRYPLVYDGDKIKFAYLKNNNPLGDTVIGFPEVLPKEFGLDQFIDRNMQWEKTFIEPLTVIASKLNWSVEKKAKLDI